jgi:GWxTD domain-containing protein
MFDLPLRVPYNLAMKRMALILCIPLFLALAPDPVIAQDDLSAKKLQLNGAEATTYKELAPRYRNWLDMVAYLTVADERKVFLRLSNDRDRDAFITMFWLQRDPTEGTPENEFKAEVEKRFAHVNEYFKRGAGRPGWMTDMGRIYMILGKPNTVESFDEKPGLYPVEVWYFFGDVSLGLPHYFNVVFYKRFGAGEWRLYNPAQDGPASLLVNDGRIDSQNYSALYQKIYTLAPNLAGPAFSMIPNESTPTLSPSLRSNFVIASIHEAPTKKLNTTYATSFLKYKGYVDVSASANFIACTNLVSLTREERYGCDLVNISLRPKKISLGYNDEKEKYFFNLNLNVSLRQGERIIFQYTKNFDFYFEPDRVQNLEGGGVVVHDSFPVIPGEYQLVVFVENSVGKEFTYFDKDITVPAHGLKPHLASPIIGYKEEVESNNFFHTYKFINRKLAVDTERTFGLSDVPHVLVGAYDLNRDLWEKGEVEIELKGLSERTKFSRTVKQALNGRPYARDLHWILPLDKAGMHSDYYELTLRLRDAAGKLLDSQKTDFTMSPIQKLAHPIETYKQVLVDSPYLFDYILGQQAEGSGNLEWAESYFKKSVQANADFAEGHVARLSVGNKLQKYSDVLSAVESLDRFPKFAFEYHLIKGTALYGLERYEPALDELLQANKSYNSDPRVLNLLGSTFYKLNDMEEALKAFEASLKLNARQPLVEKAVADIKARKQEK